MVKLIIIKIILSLDVNYSKIIIKNIFFFIFSINILLLALNPSILKIELKQPK